jgi:uncharacterized protein YdeI (YjbR/CyaY-like superfamily)
MPKDPRVDAYIAKAAPYARPILEKLRELVHRGCPEVVETIKWGMPAFEYKGPLGSMAAFKAHAVFGFWKGSLVLAGASEKEAMGQFGRLTKLSDLPDEEKLVAWVKKAAELNASGVKVARPLKHPKRPIPVPPDLKAALAKNAKARKTFEAFSPSHRREYLEWITEAKTDDTRARRLSTTLSQLAKGKSLHWKYQAKPAAKPAAKAKSARKAPKPATKKAPSAKRRGTKKARKSTAR